ncbi:nodulation protein nolNO, partial [Pseudomonadota bacterium]
MGKYYIGLATSVHDPAIAIVNSDGDVVYAEATERYLQNKRALFCAATPYFYVKEILENYCPKGSELVVVPTWPKSYYSKLR